MHGINGLICTGTVFQSCDALTENAVWLNALFLMGMTQSPRVESLVVQLALDLCVMNVWGGGVIQDLKYRAKVCTLD